MSLGLKFLSCAISVSSLFSPAQRHTGWGDLRVIGEHGKRQAGIALNPAQGIREGALAFPSLDSRESGLSRGIARAEK